jgi:hypothetical protein
VFFSFYALGEYQSVRSFGVGQDRRDNCCLLYFGPPLNQGDVEFDHRGRDKRKKRQGLGDCSNVVEGDCAVSPAELAHRFEKFGRSRCERTLGDLGNYGEMSVRAGNELASRFSGDR